MRLTNLTLILETEDIRQTVKFYTELLGFECESLFTDEENPTWTSFRKDNIVIMFSSRNCHSTIEKPTMTGSLYFNIENVNDVWDHLKDKVKVGYPIEDFDYGVREFAIYDCNGYLLQFGQEITEM